MSSLNELIPTGALGDLCGTRAIHWRKLPCGKLETGRKHKGAWEKGPLQASRPSCQRYIPLSVAAGFQATALLMPRVSGGKAERLLRKHSSILAQMLQLVPRYEFQKAVEQHGAERHSKGFSSWAQFVALPFRQIAAHDGLRGVLAGPLTRMIFGGIMSRP